MKSKHFKLKIFLLLFSVLCSLFFVADAHASDISLSIAPPLIRIEADPPADVFAPIAIENKSDDTVTMQILLKPFTASDKENGEVRYLSDSAGFGGKDTKIAEKIQISDDGKEIHQLQLAPKQRKVVQLHISLPKDEPASDYYFSIIFLTQADNGSSSTSTSNDDQNMAVAQGGIATNVLLSVGGDKTASGSIEEFSSPGIVESGPVPLTLRVRNTGTHFIEPTGTIMIKNMFGQNVGKLSLLPVSILSNTVRSIPDKKQEKDQEATSPTDNTPRIVWPETFLFGPYTATVTLSLSNDGPVFVRSTHFFALPIKALLALGSMIALILLVRMRMRSKSSS